MQGFFLQLWEWMLPFNTSWVFRSLITFFPFVIHFYLLCSDILFSICSGLHGSCQHDEACALFPHSRCFSDTCECLPRYHEIDSRFCNGTVGAFCVNSLECYGSASVCSSNSCDCPYRNGYLFNDECLPYVTGSILFVLHLCHYFWLVFFLDLHTKCYNDASCRLFPFSTCGPHFCECQSGYKPHHNVCQGPIGALCHWNQNCYVTNSFCSQGVCRCPEGHTVLNDECIRSSSKLSWFFFFQFSNCLFFRSRRLLQRFWSVHNQVFLLWWQTLSVSFKLLCGQRRLPRLRQCYVRRRFRLL